MSLKLKLSEPQDAKKSRSSAKKNSLPCGILLVDDDRLWRQLCKINLLKKTKNPQREYIFYEAENGREAVKIMAQNYPVIKVALIDLVMDKMEGMELLKLFVDKWGLDLGIFIVTAYGNEEDLEAAQLRGIRGFLDKGKVNFEQLSQQIETYLELSSKGAAKTTGFYVEVRPYEGGGYSHVFLRWNAGQGKSETFCLGRSDELETITLPNIRKKGKD